MLPMVNRLGSRYAPRRLPRARGRAAPWPSITVAPRADLRVLDGVDAGDQAVGGGQHVARVPLVHALGITEEEEDEEAQDERPDPPAGPLEVEEQPGEEPEGEDEGPAFFRELHSWGSGRSQVSGSESPRSPGESLGRDPRLAMRSQDLFHVVLERQLVQLDLFLFDLVLLGEEGLLVDLLQPPLVGLMLLVEAAELVIRLDQLRLELVVLRHTSASFACSESVR